MLSIILQKCVRMSKKSLEQQVRLAFDLRNQYGTQSRELMADRQPAESLYKTDPNLTWEQIIQKQIITGLSENRDEHTGSKTY